MTEENSKRLLSYGFTEEERKLLVSEVKKLTIDAVMNQEKILKEDLEALKRLENCREEIEKLLYQFCGFCGGGPDGPAGCRPAD